MDSLNAAGIVCEADKCAARMQPRLDFPWEDLREDLRVEHELQTAMRATAQAAAISFVRLRYRRGTGLQRLLLGYRHAPGSGCPFPKGYRLARWSAFVCALPR